MSNLNESYAVASVKAFIKRDDKILILRESKNYKGGSHIGRFVIPGGKVNEGEGFKSALNREVLEECGLDIEIGKPFYVAEWYVNMSDKPKHIVATCFICNYKNGEIKLNSEFDKAIWIDPANYEKYDINDEVKMAFREYLVLSH